MITDKSIELIAEQLGIATERIYEIFVLAQPTIAMIQITCIAFIAISAIIGYTLAKRLKWDCEPIVMAFIFGFSGMMASLVLYDCLRCYYLPEYSALVKLMDLTFGGGI